jgi:hypothetical protein
VNDLDGHLGPIPGSLEDGPAGYYETRERHTSLTNSQSTRTNFGPTVYIKRRNHPVLQLDHLSAGGPEIMQGMRIKYAFRVIPAMTVQTPFNRNHHGQDIALIDFCDEGDDTGQTVTLRMRSTNQGRASALFDCFPEH